MGNNGRYNTGSQTFMYAVAQHQLSFHGPDKELRKDKSVYGLVCLIFSLPIMIDIFQQKTEVFLQYMFSKMTLKNATILRLSWQMAMLAMAYDKQASAIREKSQRGNMTRVSLDTRQLRFNSEISQTRTDLSRFWKKCEIWKEFEKTKRMDPISAS
jgi:hypothetical protein